jgi:hypothetical protein
MIMAPRSKVEEQVSEDTTGFMPVVFQFQPTQHPLKSSARLCRAQSFSGHVV